MCGIAGCVGEQPEVIERMTAALVHRGPDGNAVTVAHGASLGHARLAILDPRPEGDQPMWNEDHTIVIVFNGEIFNYRELREREGFRCKTGTDTEVIVKMYEKYGTACIKKLRGMFAFGIYDTRTRTWILARDPSGIKPLYIARPKGNLHFASEMRSLLTAFEKTPLLNTRSLSLYMRLQYVPGPDTMCEGIESMTPGTILTAGPNGETVERFHTDQLPAVFASRASFAQEFPALMDTVVRDHLVSDRPIGIFLSGGMDSSIVLHHMAHHATKPIKTFTVRFEATEAEGASRFNADADLARKTSAYYGTEHHELLLTADLYRDYYRDTTRSLDQPNADTVSVAQYLLAKEAKRHVDVVLNGSGGDELFGGYPRYRIARILQSLRGIPPVIRSLVATMTGRPSDVLAMQPGAELAERLLARSSTEIQQISVGSWFTPSATTDLFTERYAHLQHLDPLRAFMEFDRGLWLVDESLRLADATTMGSGVECRVPFLDPRIIASSHGTPSHWHVTHQRTKALLKDTYRAVLPAHLFTLKKASFYPPLAKWLRRETSILAEEMLASPYLAEYFDMGHIRQQFEEHRSQGGYRLHTLSSLMQLHTWISAVYRV